MVIPSKKSLENNKSSNAPQSTDLTPHASQPKIISSKIKGKEIRVANIEIRQNSEIKNKIDKMS